MNGRHSCGPAVPLVEFEKGFDVDIGNPVTIGHHEAVSINVLLDLLDAAAGHRLGARVHQVDLHAFADIPPAIDPVTGDAALGTDDGTPLPPQLHFHFRAGAEETGRSASNVEEFHREIRRAEGRVVRHHALHGDLSRWIAEVLRDAVLAETVRKSERALRNRASAYEIESLRTEVLAAIQNRYQG